VVTSIAQKLKCLNLDSFLSSYSPVQAL